MATILKPDQIDALESSGHITPETASLARKSLNPMAESVSPEDQTMLANNMGISTTPSPLPETPQPTANDAIEMANQGFISPETAMMVPGVSEEPSAPEFESPIRDMSSISPAQSTSRLKGIESGFESQQRGLQMAAQAGREKALAESEFLKTTREQMEVQEAEMAKREAERRAQIDKEMIAHKKIEDEILKWEPKDFWANKSTGQKIAAVIGVTLAGIGAGMRGGENQVAKMMDNWMNDEMEAQKTQLQKLKDVNSAKQTLLGKMLQQFGDERQAEAAAKTAMLSRAEMQLKETAAKFRAPEIQAKAQQALGELQVLKNSTMQQFEQASQAKQVLLKGGAQLPAGLDIEQLPADQRERYVPGLGLATTKEGAKEMREFKGTVDTINSGVNQLLAFTNKSGDSFNPAERQRAKTIASMLVGQLRLPIVGPGAFTEREMELLQSIVANPTKIASLDAVSRASLETISQRMNGQLSDKARANGLKPIGQQVTTFQPR